MLNWYLFLSGFQFLVEIIAYDIYPPVFLCCRHQNNKYSLELFDRKLRSPIRRVSKLSTGFVIR